MATNNFPTGTIGLGLASLSIAYGVTPPDKERLAFLDRALELGLTFWDTAQVYGDSEDLLRQFFASRSGAREKVFLCTKFGIGRNPQTGSMDVDSSGKNVRRSFYAHRCNPETPIEETMRAMVELQKEGKIKHIGFSEISSKALRRASKIGKVAAVQMEYSPFELEDEDVQDVMKTCRKAGTSIICYSPLGRGLLTGSFSTRESVSGEGDIRSFHYPRFSEDNIEANARTIQEFKALATRKGCTPSQLALAWLLKQGKDVVPIPGTKRIKYLEENWAARDVKLSDQEESQIRRLVRRMPLQGVRSKENAALTFTDTREEACL
ncbi:Hypothetical predicted protein [Lecanosticta acicola]|uniref:NADP-dependent oxidoreductase domain-containing protein n=1 Tax=Lecanosticta acicola TaxID=111012 RepID=A0AAI8Z5N3_9PEZI|nr:Hypothetical predicted protein [Lecanosticta acicola]